MSDHTDQAYSLRNVHRRAGDREVLRAITLDIPARRLTVLAGPSGSGKTSLLRLLNRLDEPTSGQITYRGTPIHALPVTELRRRVGFVFQKPHLFAGTVTDNLREAAEIIGLVGPDREAEFARALALAELEAPLASRRGDVLSVGQQQRATIARALLSRPETLLLDEPTSALDPKTSAALLRTIARLTAEEGVTVVMSTHRMDEVRYVAHGAVVMHEGHVTQIGPASTVLATGALHDTPSPNPGSE